MSGRDNVRRHDARRRSPPGLPATGQRPRRPTRTTRSPRSAGSSGTTTRTGSLVAYMFHTRAGERVLVARGDGAEVEGILGGVRAGTQARRAAGRPRRRDLGLHAVRRRRTGPPTAAAGRSDETLRVPASRGPPTERRRGRAVDAADQHGGTAVTQTPDLEAMFATLEQLPPHGGSRVPRVRGAQPRAVGRVGRRSSETGCCRPRVTRASRPRTSPTEAVYAMLEPRGPRDRGRSRLPVTSARSCFLPGTIFTLVTRVRVKDLGVTIVEEFDPDSGGRAAAHRPRGRRRRQIGRAILEAELRSGPDRHRRASSRGDIA